MANPIKGEAQLGEFTLVFNFGAFCQLEEKTGQRMPALLQMVQDGLGFTELRDFVWAGLQTNHSDVSEERLLSLIDEVGFNAAAQATGKAVSGFFGKQREKAKNPPKAGQAGTG